jgi:hypothetical protein
VRFRIIKISPLQVYSAMVWTMSNGGTAQLSNSRVVSTRDHRKRNLNQTH